MKTAEYYKLLPVDVSGSRSKNRFRVEILWGLSKMLDLMEQPDDFTMVFDYVCDIEVHYKDELEFYQIKSHNAKQTSFTAKKLTEKGKKENSILGKLYIIRDPNTDIKIKLAIVSNIPYRKLSTDVGELSFSGLDDKEKAIILKALKTEIGISDMEWDDIYFVFTNFNFAQPEDEVKGRLLTCFEKIEGCEPVRPIALYRLIYETVADRACYEYKENDYYELIKRKGISREELKKMLDAHSNAEKTGVPQTEEYINNLIDIKSKRTMKKALASVMTKYPVSRSIQALEKEMVDVLEKTDKLGETEDAIDLLSSQFHERFPVEYDNAEKTVLYLIVINKYAEGGYDNEIDF